MGFFQDAAAAAAVNRPAGEKSSMDPKKPRSDPEKPDWRPAGSNARQAGAKVLESLFSLEKLPGTAAGGD